MTRKLVLLPGMTPSRRIFQKLAPHLVDCEVIDWIAPGRAKTISDYAHKLVDEAGIDSSSDLGGVSFGGMVAQEVAKYCGVRLCFVVSSVRSSAELRPTQRILAHLPQCGDLAVLGVIGAVAQVWPRMGSSMATVRARKFRGVHGDLYRWATSAALRWQSSPDGRAKLIRIHGDRDSTFPQGDRCSDHVIVGAGHMLALTHSHELARIIHQLQAEAEVSGPNRLNRSESNSPRD